MKMDLSEIGEVIELVKDFSVVAEPVVEVIEAYGPAIKRLLDAAYEYRANRCIADIKIYEGAGFSREEAILLTIDSRLAIGTLLNSLTAASKRAAS